MSSVSKLMKKVELPKTLYVVEEDTNNIHKVEDATVSESLKSRCSCGLLEATWTIKEGKGVYVNRIEFSAANAFETLTEAKQFVDARILKKKRDARSSEFHRYNNTKSIKLGYLRSHPEQALETFLEFGNPPDEPMSSDDLKVTHLREILDARGGYDHFVRLVLNKEFPILVDDQEEDE